MYTKLQICLQVILCLTVFTHYIYAIWFTGKPATVTRMCISSEVRLVTLTSNLGRELMNGKKGLFLWTKTTMFYGTLKWNISHWIPHKCQLHQLRFLATCTSYPQLTARLQKPKTIQKISTNSNGDRRTSIDQQLRSVMPTATSPWEILSQPTQSKTQQRPWKPEKGKQQIRESAWYS